MVKELKKIVTKNRKIELLQLETKDVTHKSQNRFLVCVDLDTGLDAPDWKRTYCQTFRTKRDALNEIKTF